MEGGYHLVSLLLTPNPTDPFILFLFLNQNKYWTLPLPFTSSIQIFRDKINLMKNYYSFFLYLKCIQDTVRILNSENCNNLI